MGSSINSLVNVGFSPEEAKHIAAQVGWCDVDETWAYVSATQVNGLVGSNRYQVGDRIRLTQGGVVKYFCVALAPASPFNALDIRGDVGAVVTNETISSIAYSRCERPYGFPATFAWTPAKGTGWGAAGIASVVGEWSMWGATVEYRASWVLAPDGTSTQQTVTGLPIPAVTGNFPAPGYALRPAVGLLQTVGIVSSSTLFINKYDAGALPATYTTHYYRGSYEVE